MLDSLDMQMKQREEDVRQEKEDSIKQVLRLAVGPDLLIRPCLLGMIAPTPPVFSQGTQCH